MTVQRNDLVHSVVDESAAAVRPVSDDNQTDNHVFASSV